MDEPRAPYDRVALTTPQIASAKRSKLSEAARTEAESRLRAERPDFVIILPWNLKQEITEQLAYIREWGGQFVTAVPQMDVY